MKLTTEQALIMTAIVEVKLLTISGKQVTLAVFRQLQDEGLILDWDSLALRGIVWGKVNYHFEKCEMGDEHLHLVWQLGDELRRCTVFQTDPTDPWKGERKARRLERFLKSSAQTFVCTRIIAGERDLPSSENLPTKLKVNGRLLEVYLTHDEEKALSPIADTEPEDEWLKKKWENHKKARQELINTFGITTLEEAKTNLLKAEAELTAYEAVWGKLYKSLCSVPQLFIAV